MIGAARVAAVMLAAGAARRFGGGKLDAAIDGEAVGARAWRCLEGPDWALRRLIVAPSPPDFAADLPIMVNPDAAQGFATSLALAARAAWDSGVDALLVTLADMPFLTAGSIAALLAAHDGADPEAVTASIHPDGLPGPPAVFGRGWFARLAGLSGDRGARPLLAAAGDRLVTVAIPAGELADIDTPADLRAGSIR